MQRQSLAVITHIHLTGEREAVVSLFSKDFGLVKGFLRITKDIKPWVQLGNLVSFQQTKRLDSQLGTLKILNLEHNFSLLAFEKSYVSRFLNYICTVLSLEFKEEDAQEAFFVQTLALLNGLDKTPWQALGFWEKELLEALGFGLSITPDKAHPDAKGKQLYYVSPKTGVAVSEEMGAQYKDKLLLLPQLFGGKSPEMLDLFRLTGHFLRGILHKDIYAQRDKLVAYGQKHDFKESV